MNLPRLFFISALILLSFSSFAYQLSGTITDQENMPVAYASIYIKNTTKAVTSNLKGQYFIELPVGSHEIIFYAIGFEKKELTVYMGDKNQTLNISLEPIVIELNDVSIIRDGKDPAYEIIKNAIRMKDKYKNPLERYTCNAYIKCLLEKEYLKKDTSKSIKDNLSKEKMNFIETYSKVYFEYPGKLKEIKEGYRDQSEKYEDKFSVNISFRQESGPKQETKTNNNLFKINLSEANFNFYYNTIDVPVLHTAMFVSPISSGALLSYNYHLEEYFLEDGYWINKIKVIPKRTDAPLFKGYIYIVDKIWSIKSVDLQIDPAYLTYYDHFSMIQNYEMIGDSVWMLAQEEFFYNVKEGKKMIIGNTFIRYSNYDISPTIPEELFDNEQMRTLDDANEKDSVFWQKVRPLTLKSDELLFIDRQDSIETYHASAEYLHQQDSIMNRLSWDEILLGMYFRNSFKKHSFYIDGLALSANPLGIGGYRQTLSGNIQKEWSRAYQTTLNARLNYGFTNRDLKGEVGGSFLYLPKRFARLHARYADEYDFLNSYEAISSTFSMSNYVNAITYGVGHEIEVANGLYLDVFGEFVKKRSIDQLKFSGWSKELFGENNIPPSFEGNNQVLLDIKLEYTFKQKYYTEPYKKIIIGSKYPTVSLNYRKGIKGVFNSIANFDFVEIHIKDDFKIGIFGQSKLNVYMGTYLNKGTVVLTEKKFFRGSDPYFFSNPLRSFQLLGPSISTTTEYLQAHYFHRFNGALLNKVPGIKRLHLQEVAGGGILLIKDNSFKHAEIFTGLEKIFKIKRTVFKAGMYYVVSDSNHTTPSNSFKVGIDILNPFDNSWSY